MSGLHQRLALPRRVPVLVCAIVCGMPAPRVAAGEEESTHAALRHALTFHAPFDGKIEAAFALGDRRIYTRGDWEKGEGSPGLRKPDVVIAATQGRYGDALRFGKQTKETIYFSGERNVAYRRKDWSGTVAWWMSLDPDRDLVKGFYCDPLTVSGRAWNDASLFIDFTRDDSPRHMRLAAFADLKVWNPKGLEWEQVAVSDRPMHEVTKPPFARGKWTHVAIGWSNFNTGHDDGVAKLYLNGRYEGAIKGRRQTFTWDSATSKILLGIYYVGLMDDLAVFNRALSDNEVRAVYDLPSGVGSLHQ